jgi:anti-sigma B factor antagonist
MFAVRIETIDEAAVCRVQGEVDAASAAALREALVALTAYRQVVLDFSGVPFIDSAGLGCLIAGARRIHAVDGAVVLCSARRAVDRLLHTVGMDGVLPMVATLPEALELVQVAQEEADMARAVGTG